MSNSTLNPKVSILIPIFNSEKYIVETLQSAIDQDWSNKEIIVVDDGSTDKSFLIAKSFESDVVKVYRQENKGACAARNKALKLSSGLFVQFLDADDIIVHNKVKNQIAGFSDESIDWVVSDRIVKDDTLTKTIHEFTFNKIEADPLNTAISNIIITGNPLYKRSAVLAIGGYDESLNSAQDWDFHLRLILNGHKPKYVKGCYLISRNTPFSLSSNLVKVNVQASELIFKYKSIFANQDLNVDSKNKIIQILYYTSIYHPNKEDVKKHIDEILFWGVENLYLKKEWKKTVLYFFGIYNLISIERFLVKYIK